MLSRRRLLSAFSAIAALPGYGSGTSTTHASNFPDRPINLVVPFPPGTGLDVIMRAMAPLLQRRLQKPVLVENRAGGGGNIAAASVARSQPDGHTILAATTSLAANPMIYKALPFDTLADFQAVSLVMRTPYILVVNPSLRVKNVSELIALLKQKPGEISYTHSGAGGAVQLTTKLFEEMSGTKMLGVSYRGGPQALNDVISGRISVTFADVGSTLPQLNSGALLALGVTSLQRLQVAPHIPTIAESGLPGFDSVGWILLCTPSGVPAPTIDILASELRAAAAHPQVRELIIRIGYIPVDSPSPPELQAFLAKEIRRLGKLVELAGEAKTL